MYKNNKSIVGVSLIAMSFVACGPGPMGESATAGESGLTIFVPGSGTDTAGTEGSTGENSGGDGEAGGENGSTTSADGESESNGNSTTSGPVDTTTTTTGGYDPDKVCAEATLIASEIEARPTDIIIAVDNSSSMYDELEFVQEGMNDFVAAITKTGIDAHVAMLTNHMTCIPSPLGSGEPCSEDDPDADDNLPKYDHVITQIEYNGMIYENVGVESNDALTRIIDHYDSWKGITRENSKKFVLVVSDDNAYQGNNLMADDFHPMFANLGPSYQDYVFTGIIGMHSYDSDPMYCSVPGPQQDCCNIVSIKGTEYIKLAELTGGLNTDICEGLWGGNFNTVFDLLTQEIIDEGGIQCEIEIPEDNGMGDIDYDDAAVDYNDGGNTQSLPQVNDESACANVPGGKAWYYDDNMNPQTIHVCPAFCESVQGNANGSFDVTFGCEGIVPG